MNSMCFFQERVENTISPRDFMTSSERYPDTYFLVDVRNGSPEIIREKIKGALSIPLDELKSRTGELDDSKTIILYCWNSSCNMAARAAIILIRQEYSVLELSGGIASWKQQGLPVESLVDLNSQ